MTTKKTFPDGATHRRYDVRTEGGAWLAVVFLGADGFFSTVSDYGNYGHWWGSTGRDDFRDFLCGTSADYLVGKFSPEWEMDPDASEIEVKKCIIRLRREGTLTADEARAEWELLSYVRDGDDGGWWANTDLGKHAWPADLWLQRRSPQAVAFVEKVMPRLVLMLRAEMAAEKEVLAVERVNREDGAPVPPVECQ